MRPIHLAPRHILPALLAAGIALVLAGCGTGKSPRIQPPRTDLQVEADGWKVKMSGEKDSSLESLTVKIYNGPDLITDVALVGLVSTNSESIVTATGTGQRAIIDAQGNVINAQGQIIGNIADTISDWSPAARLGKPDPSNQSAQ